MIILECLGRVAAGHKSLQLHKKARGKRRLQWYYKEPRAYVLKVIKENKEEMGSKWERLEQVYVYGAGTVTLEPLS